MSRARELAARHELPLYAKRGPVLVRGAGARLWDEAGREYLDCAAGIGVATVGHAHPRVAAALERQARTLITCPGSFDNDVRSRLLARLAGIAPPGLDRAFLCSSGAEAVEAALKLARHSTGRAGFVCAMRGFHGRTLGALSATFKHRRAFEPLLEGFRFVPFNDPERLAAAVDGDTAAVVIELVQGEGGVRPASAEFVAAARAACARHGALLLVDEVQTGFCRTGRMFACEHFDLVPDLLCLAKGIAGGVPMGAVLAGERIAARPGIHGSTFGGNPLACAAALAAIEVMLAEDLAGRAERLGARLRAALGEPPPAAVREVRGLGMMIGIELRGRVQPVLEALLERGLIALPAGRTVLRLLPPLVIEEAEIDACAALLREVLG